MLTHRQIMLVLVGLSTGMFLAALDQTIIATALPVIVGELGGLSHLSWVVSAYMLTSTAATPLFGKVSDLYGRRALFQAAIVIFLLGSVLAGLSRSMGQLIAFRALQGVGAGGLLGLSMAIVGDVVSPRQRGRYQGYLGGVFALASVGGPLLGGFFADHLSWRWVFYINLPLGAVALVVTRSALDLPFRRVEHRIDYLGSALLVAAVSCILLVTVWGGAEHPWTSPVILLLAAAGAALTVLFVLQERRSPEPVLPMRLFANPVFRVASGAGFALGLAMFGAIVFLPLFLQVAVGASATNSGLLLAPLMAGIVASSITAGRLITRTGRYKVFPVAGTAILTVGLYLLSTMDRHTTMQTTFVFMVVVGAGMGLIMQVLVLAVQNSVEARDLGVATSAATFFRSMGGAFGVALFGSILNSRVQGHLARVLPGVDAAEFQGRPEAIRSLPAPVREAFVDAFAQGTHAVFLWAIPVGVVAFLLVLLLKEHPLREWAYVGPAEQPAPTGYEGAPLSARPPESAASGQS